MDEPDAVLAAAVTVAIVGESFEELQYINLYVCGISSTVDFQRMGK